MSVLTVVGARPQFVKAAVVSAALKAADAAPSVMSDAILRLRTAWFCTPCLSVMLPLATSYTSTPNATFDMRIGLRTVATEPTASQSTCPSAPSFCWICWM